MARDAVILLTLGGPDSPAAVEPFLFNLFSDPDIFTVPLGGLVQKPLARLLARMRARHVAEHYREIGGASPILAHTQAQARRLAEKLAPVLESAVYIGMRYWHPFIAEALEEALRRGARRLILLPLYPQYSLTTTGSSLHEVERWLAERRPRELEVITIRSYPDHPLYVRAVVERIEEALGRFSEGELNRWALVFSAHGLPVRYITNGDPYLDETRRSVAAVVAQLQHRPAVASVLARAETLLSFQSKVGPLKWLEPSTAETVRQLGHEGITHLLVVPISFVSDNIETLYELNIELREIARQSGITTFIVAEALNDSETFADALAALVLEAAGYGC